MGNELNLKQIRNDLFSYNEMKVKSQINNILFKSGIDSSEVTKKYFFELMCDTIIRKSKMSVNQFFDLEDAADVLNYHFTTYDKYFQKGDSALRKTKQFFRSNCTCYASIPTQFPFDYIDRLLEKYTEPDQRFIDPCCGWGQRYLASQKHRLNYTGFDINTKLTEKIKELDKYIKLNDINTDNHILNEDCRIRKPDLQSKGDFVFTSPPYFNIEKYDKGKQVFTEDYEVWREKFLKPLCDNMVYMCKDGGTIGVNIKNYTNEAMLTDTFNFLCSHHIKFVRVEKLYLANKWYGMKTNFEYVLIFENVIVENQTHDENNFMECDDLPKFDDW